MIVVVVMVEGIYDWITEVSTYASPHKVNARTLITCRVLCSVLLCVLVWEFASCKHGKYEGIERARYSWNFMLPGYIIYGFMVVNFLRFI